MVNEKFIPLIKGAITTLPGVKPLLNRRTGGTISSRYCYSVWLRHLIKLRKVESIIPDVVAELGPGDSIGVGLAALLTGSTKYFALDVIPYWDSKRNLQIFNELIALFKNKENIPGKREFPFVGPEIENYAFPSDIIPESLLKKSLSEKRIEEIKREIISNDSSNNKYIFYQSPWYDDNVIRMNSIDFIYSQAVLEHVDDLDGSYQAMNKWLKTSGYMAHTIDFRSHGITKSWNGHWTFSDFEWKIVKGNRVYLLNRQPFSYHIKLNNQYGFHILDKVPVKSKNFLKREQLAKRFKHFNEEELTTSGIYILSKKQNGF